jgi:hypothetical protein
VLGKKILVAALHDFVPRLPWWLYRATQGAFHRWVMARFADYVSRTATSANGSPVSQLPK